MPMYEWKCTKCGVRVEVQRPVSEYNQGPRTISEIPASPCDHDWVRVISVAAVPFETLRDKGVFEHQLQTSARYY